MNEENIAIERVLSLFLGIAFSVEQHSRHNDSFSTQNIIRDENCSLHIDTKQTESWVAVPKLKPDL